MENKDHSIWKKLSEIEASIKEPSFNLEVGWNRIQEKQRSISRKKMAFKNLFLLLMIGFICSVAWYVVKPESSKEIIDTNTARRNVDVIPYKNKDSVVSRSSINKEFAHKFPLPPIKAGKEKKDSLASDIVVLPKADTLPAAKRNLDSIATSKNGKQTSPISPYTLDEDYRLGTHLPKKFDPDSLQKANESVRVRGRKKKSRR